MFDLKGVLRRSVNSTFSRHENAKRKSENKIVVFERTERWRFFDNEEEEKGDLFFFKFIISFVSRLCGEKGTGRGEL